MSSYCSTTVSVIIYWLHTVFISYCRVNIQLLILYWWNQALYDTFSFHDRSVPERRLPPPPPCTPTPFSLNGSLLIEPFSLGPNFLSSLPTTASSPRSLLVDVKGVVSPRSRGVHVICFCHYGSSVSLNPPSFTEFFSMRKFDQLQHF